jgi:hypothetical protein
MRLVRWPVGGIEVVIVVSFDGVPLPRHTLVNESQRLTGISEEFLWVRKWVKERKSREVTSTEVRLVCGKSI